MARWVRSVVFAGLLSTVACSSGSAVSDPAPPMTEASQERVVYVALGGDETINRQLDDPLREAWPQLLFTGTLPRTAVYVNFGRPDATVSGALTEQVPGATDLEPTLATVWFGVGDARARTSEASFTEDLSEVVTRLQGAGAQVLLLTKQVGGEDETRFARAVTRVVEATGATLVVVPDGDDTLSATQEAVADAVAGGLAE
jgi:hypothetical protein